MPVYEFECEKCGKVISTFAHVSEYDAITMAAVCCNQPMNQVLTKNYAFKLGRTDGRYTGFYDYDYGKKATWDLTPPGKMEALKKAGVIRDPFEG